MKLNLRCKCLEKDPYLVKKYCEDLSSVIKLNIEINNWCGQTAFLALCMHVGQIMAAHPNVSAEDVKAAAMEYIDLGIAEVQNEKTAHG
jgi:hypothetical protein